MNYYFLLEDEKSFLKVLPSWLESLDFGCKRVADIMSVEENNYILQSGQGVTQLITKVLYDTIDTILQRPGKIDKLVVIVDAENERVVDRKNQVVDKVLKGYGEDLPFEVVVIVCNCCFETWLLGCNGLYPQEVSMESDFFRYYSYYNIEVNDPELMEIPCGVRGTKAKYHFQYLHTLFLYKKIRFNKKKPDFVKRKEYLDGIVNRIMGSSQLCSFKEFYDFIIAERKNRINNPR